MLLLHGCHKEFYRYHQELVLYVEDLAIRKWRKKEKEYIFVLQINNNLH